LREKIDCATCSGVKGCAPGSVVMGDHAAEVAVTSAAEVEGGGGSASGVEEIGGGAGGCDDGKAEAFGTRQRGVTVPTCYSSRMYCSHTKKCAVAEGEKIGSEYQIAM
jgi:hypothetical protein